MDEGTTFHRVLWDRGTVLPDAQIRRVVLCSGKVYYDLFEEREKHVLKDVYLLRVEQLFPYPHEVLADEFKRFPKAEIVWCQEEPRNMGAWHFMIEPLAETLASLGRGGDKVRYAGRPPSASPATGTHSKHVQQQARLVAEALGLADGGKRK
jgi:2-oxoglutarate dehydrogenase E1 component